MTVLIAVVSMSVSGSHPGVFIFVFWALTFFVLSFGWISCQLSTVVLLHKEALPETRFSPGRLHEPPEPQLLVPVLLLPMRPVSPSAPLRIFEVEVYVWILAV